MISIAISPSGGFLRALKRASNSGTFFGVEDFQADRFTRLAVASHVEARHGAADRLAQQLEPLRHINAAVLEHIREFFEEFQRRLAGSAVNCGMPPLSQL